MVNVQVDSGTNFVFCRNMSCKQYCVAFLVISLLIVIGICSLAGWITMGVKDLDYEGKVNTD